MTDKKFIAVYVASVVLFAGIEIYKIRERRAAPLNRFLRWVASWRIR